MSEEKKQKQYKLPVFCHKSRIRCETCGSDNVKPSGTKYNGYIKFWMCQECKTGAKTVGQEI